jgi:DNA-binding transcriptional MerR regulator
MPGMDTSRLLIGDLARRAGVSASALRYYEAAGLLAAEARTESGYRVYGSQAALRLGFIRRAKALGFKLSEIKRLVEMPRANREAELAVFNRVLDSKISEIRARIGGLRETERELRRLESALQRRPPASRCHLGDCGCWLPV